MDVGHQLPKGDVVTDPADNKRYAAKNDLTPSTTAPSADSTNWDDVDSKDTSVTAAQVQATGKSQLSDTSVISATGGNVKITSSVKTNITSIADSSLAGSGAGISVAVLTTDSEAFVDSTAPAPITAKNLTVSADTDNTAPTTGTASPRGAKGNDESANSADRANGKSATSDGSQNLTAALAVTVLVATTKAYISPTDAGSMHTISTAGGTQTIHAGTRNAVSAIADAGDVKLSPDAPTLSTVSSGGTLADATYYYKIAATSASGESLPSTEASIATTGGGTSKVTLSWTSVAGATGYKIYRGSSSGGEQLLATVGAVTTYTDDGSLTPSGAAPPTTDASSGVGVAVAVDVAVVDTEAYLAGNASLVASSVTVETTAPGPSSFAARSTSGAGGSGVGVAGSIAVNVVTNGASAAVQTPAPVTVAGDLTLTAASNLGNQATARREAGDQRQRRRDRRLGRAQHRQRHGHRRPRRRLRAQRRAQPDADRPERGHDDDERPERRRRRHRDHAGRRHLALEREHGRDDRHRPGSDRERQREPPRRRRPRRSRPRRRRRRAARAAALGAGLALTVANHTATASLARDLSAAGDVHFTTQQASTTSSVANASANGASSGSSNVTQQVGNQRSLADSTAPVGGGSGGTATPAASTSDGPVSVAAAIAANISSTSSTATIGGVTVTAGGAVGVKATGDTDAKANADGSVVGAGSLGIGAAVAINLANVTVSATVGTGGTVTSDQLALEAAMNGVSGDGTHRLSATSVSGAGAGTVGVAGSLALNIVNLHTSALLNGSYARGPPLGPTSGDVSLRATSVSDSQASATAGVTGAGFGASVAINLVDDSTQAAVADGSALTNAHDLSLQASSTDSMTTLAKTGAAGGGVGVAAAVAVAVSNVSTGASVGTGALTTLIGLLDVRGDPDRVGHDDGERRHDELVGRRRRRSGADARHAFGRGPGRARPERRRHAHRRGRRRVLARRQCDRVGERHLRLRPSGGVDGQVAAERSHATSVAGGSSAPASPSANTSAGPVAVAAAVALTIASTSSLASVSGAGVTAGAVTIASKANTDSQAKADGSAAHGGPATVGAAVAINLADVYERGRPERARHRRVAHRRRLDERRRREAHARRRGDLGRRRRHRERGRLVRAEHRERHDDVAPRPVRVGDAHRRGARGDGGGLHRLDLEGDGRVERRLQLRARRVGRTEPRHRHRDRRPRRRGGLGRRRPHRPGRRHRHDDDGREDGRSGRRRLGRPGRRGRDLERLLERDDRLRACDLADGKPRRRGHTSASATTTGSGDVSGGSAAVGAIVVVTVANHNATASVARAVTAAGTATLRATRRLDDRERRHRVGHRGSRRRRPRRAGRWRQRPGRRRALERRRRFGRGGRRRLGRDVDAEREHVHRRGVRVGGGCREHREHQLCRLDRVRRLGHARAASPRSPPPR